MSRTGIGAGIWPRIAGVPVYSHLGPLTYALTSFDTKGNPGNRLERIEGGVEASGPVQGGAYHAHASGGTTADHPDSIPPPCRDAGAKPSGFRVQCVVVQIRPALHSWGIGSVSFLVLELVEGPTLAERIVKGPVPPEEAEE